jgi:hypothetical protein
MAEHKFIYWFPNVPKNDKGESAVQVHILVGYTQGSITDFIEMADELRKTFPQAENKDIRGGKIIESSCVYGNTIIWWNTYLATGEYPGWEQIQDGVKNRHEYEFNR